MPAPESAVESTTTLAWAVIGAENSEVSPLTVLVAVAVIVSPARIAAVVWKLKVAWPLKSVTKVAVPR